jgi:hypothetical protein
MLMLQNKKFYLKTFGAPTFLPKLWGLLFAPLSDVLCQHLAEASRSKRRLYRYASGSLISHPFTIVLTPYSLLNVPRVLPWSGASCQPSHELKPSFLSRLYFRASGSLVQLDPLLNTPRAQPDWFLFMLQPSYWKVQFWSSGLFFVPILRPMLYQLDLPGRYQGHRVKPLSPYFCISICVRTDSVCLYVCMRARERTISLFCLSSKEGNRMCILHVSFLYPHLYSHRLQV